MSEEFGVVARITSAEEWIDIQKDNDRLDNGNDTVLTSKIQKQNFDWRVCYIRFHCLKFTEKAKLSYTLYTYHEDNGNPANLLGWTNFTHPAGKDQNFADAKNRPFKEVLADMVRDISNNGGARYKLVKDASLKNMNLRHRAFHVFMVDHDGWEFCGDINKVDPGPVPIRFAKDNNYSFFDGAFESINLDVDGRQRHAFYMINHRKNKARIDDLPDVVVPQDQQENFGVTNNDTEYDIKFDVYVKAPLVGGGKLIVIFDPGGNNGGNTFAPPPPP
jgi:hypothetical protein